MILFRVTDIVWDMEGEGEETQEGAGLPDSAYVHADCEDDVTDHLSDNIGFCIKTLNIEPCEDYLVFAG